VPCYRRSGTGINVRASEACSLSSVTHAEERERRNPFHPCCSGSARGLGREELECDKSPEFRVLGLVNDTHTPAAEFLDDAVVGDVLADELGACGHWRESQGCSEHKVNDGSRPRRRTCEAQCLRGPHDVNDCESRGGQKGIMPRASQAADSGDPIPGREGWCTRIPLNQRPHGPETEKSAKVLIFQSM